MKKNHIIFLLYAVFFANLALAQSFGSQKSYSQVVAISLGPTWNETIQDQTFYLAPEIEKTYATNNSTNVLADGEVFLGLQKSLSYQWQGQLGIAFAVAGNAEISGDIWDDANPLFNNYTYHYKIKHNHFALKGKLLADRGYWVIPWISASLGVGINTAFDFNNTPTIFEALPNTDFKNNTMTAFTYTVGIGLQKPFNPHWQAGVGYEFADWGEFALGQAIDQTTHSGPGNNHLYTNGILFNITYLA